MNDVNNGTVCGRLVRDAEVDQVGGTSVTKFTVAVHRHIKATDQERTYFFACDWWGPAGRFAASKLRKGTFVVVEYALEQNQWTDEDGGRHNEYKLAVKDVTFIPLPAGE